jgi:Lsr2
MSGSSDNRENVVGIHPAVPVKGGRSRAASRSSTTVAPLASTTIGELVDDTDGKTADETVSFGLDGQNFEIDLGARNAKSLREALRPYTEAGRRYGPGRRTLHALPRTD